MTADRLPSARPSSQDVGVVVRLEDLSIGYTPEALIRRVNQALTGMGLTGVEGNAFERSFNLRLRGDGNGFILESPPRRKNLWDSEEHFIPDIHAQVDKPSEWLPHGQIIWMDISTVWRGYDEIGSGQKVSMVLDQLLSGIEGVKPSDQSQV